MAGDLDKRLKISTRHQLSALIFLLILAALILVYLIWIKLNNSNSDFVHFMSISLIIGFGLNAIPVIFLHYDYWEVNRGEEYDVLFDRLVRWKNGKREDILGSSIDKITVYLCPSMYKGSNLHFLGIEAYYFARVELNSGEKFYLTCLLHPKLDDILKTLKGVHIYRKKTFFPSLK